MTRPFEGIRIIDVTVDREFDVPLAAFKIRAWRAERRAVATRVRRRHDAVLAERGYDAEQIAALRRARVI